MSFSHSILQLPLLVHELLVVEVWRDKVFPVMLQICKAPTSSFITYIVVSQTFCNYFTPFSRRVTLNPPLYNKNKPSYA